MCIQTSNTSLVAQRVKRLPAMRETWVRLLVWEDPREKGKATHSSILALQYSGLDNSREYIVHGGFPRSSVGNLPALQKTWV